MKTDKSKNHIVLCLISMMLALSACSKYEEGPWISFRSVDARVPGDYRIELFTKNGNDLTSYWNDIYDLTFVFHNADAPSFYPYYMKVEGSIEVDGYNMIFFSENNYSISINSEMVELSFQQHIDTINFPNRYLYPLLVFPDDDFISFTITRLTKDQLWLKHTHGDDEYIIHFEE